jgi:hypothetical protein
MFVILGLYVDDSILVFNNTLFLNNTKKGIVSSFYHLFNVEVFHQPRCQQQQW